MSDQSPAPHHPDEPSSGAAPTPVAPGATRIAWIGVGVMGAPMARHLLDAGYDLTVNTRTERSAHDLVAAGATWAPTPALACSDADVACVMVGYPADVEQVILGSDGALRTMAPGGALIDFTTSSPALAETIAASAADANIGALDAPVSGGDVGARNATLSIMLGGDPATVSRVQPLLDLLGSTVVHQGPAGAGQRTKIVNQTLIAGTMVGLSEALLYAHRCGLDPNRVLQSVGSGAAASWSLTNLAPRVLGGDTDPGFFVEHFVKDLGLALDEAELLGLDLPGLALATQLYERLAELGHQRSGTQALPVALAALNELPWPPPAV
jgi:3-hydroxyisobutyrate dehydrogenase